MKQRLFIAASALVFISSTIFAQEPPLNPAPFVIPQLITIQKQDLESIKRLQQENEKMRDYNNRQAVIDEITKELLKKREELFDHTKASKIKIKSAYVEKIEVSENKILMPEEIADTVKDYEKNTLTSSSVKELIKRLDELCIEKGYITAFAYLPEQKVNKGVLKIAIQEGKIGKIKIDGNRWTEESHILSRLDMHEGDDFNMKELANNIMTYNRYNEGVILKADLNPGEKENTTDIDITTEERAPYHIMAVADNSGRDAVGRNRAGLLTGHDSLFGYRDKLSGGIFANLHSKTPFIDYTVPVNDNDDRVGLSFSHNQAKTGHGPLKDLNIETRSQNYSIYYTHPFIHKLHDELSTTASYTYKRSITKAAGRKIHEDKIPELKTSLNYRHDTENGVWYLSQSVSYAAPWYQKNIDYFKFEGSASRLQDFGYRIFGYFRGSYQYTPRDKVPVIDQMSVGGIGTVRGYSPNIMITAKSGYQLNAEIYLPAGPQEFNIGDKFYHTDEYVRPFVFADYAALYPYRGSDGDSLNKNDILLSAGAGLRLQLPYDIVLKATYGVPLKHTRYDEHHGNWNLEIGFSPDLNKFFNR